MASTLSNSASTIRERGAIILTFSMMLVVLIGFAAIAIDLGRLFIVRTELQTALDSCALAGAQELDGQSTALTRAASAGVTAGNLNNVNLQSATWAGQPKLVTGDVTFKDVNYNVTTDAASARYVQCQHTQAGVKAWLLPALAKFSGAAVSSTSAVMSTAVATRANAQSACPVPVGLRAINNTPPDYGFAIGQWVNIYGKTTGANPGEMGWYNLDGSTNASETATEMGEAGVCGIKVADVLGTPGAQSSIDTIWNQRFGIYKNNDGPSLNHPDLTGYAYTTLNWPAGQNAYNGPIPPNPVVLGAENFVTKRAKFASFDNTGTDVKAASDAVLGKGNAGLTGSYKTLATPGPTGDHAKYGYSRRLVIVPVLKTGSNAVADFACMLMLAPLNGPNATGQMEYRGNANRLDSPCTTNGFAGGAAGPLVPVLVR